MTTENFYDTSTYCGLYIRGPQHIVLRHMVSCPFCSNTETKVLDKRPNPAGDATRRRRECLKCGKRFTTYEKVEAKPLMIIKKDGRREPFSRDKLRNGLLKACEKRPISHDAIEKVVDDIERKLRNSKKAEIQSRAIGEFVMKKLMTLDKVAYIRFASVYREFKDIKHFEEELKKIRK